MRDPKRIKNICELLEKWWMQHPDQRLGQLLENYIFYNGERGDRTSLELFNQDDDFTEDILLRLNK